METKKLTKTEWQETVKEQRCSGLSQKAWCGKNGINYYTFLKQAGRFKQNGNGLENNEAAVKGQRALREGKPATGWIELGTACKSKPENGEVEEKIQIEVGVFRIVLPQNFNETPLKRVCKALAELC